MKNNFLYILNKLDTLFLSGNLILGNAQFTNNNGSWYITAMIKRNKEIIIMENDGDEVYLSMRGITGSHDDINAMINKITEYALTASNK